MQNPFEVYTSLNKTEKKRSLDWDESALDSQHDLEEVYDSDRRAPKLNWLILFTAAIFLILSGRIFYLQIVQGAKFRTLSENNRLRRQVILAPRGKIVDNYNQILAENTASYNLVATPVDLPKTGLDAEIKRLAEDLNLNADEISQKISKADLKSIQPVVVAQNISQSQSILFETESSSFIGFSVEEIPVRSYENGQVFSAVLGYSGLLSPGDLVGKNKDLYAVEDYIGKLGIEEKYEDLLHGKNGENLIEVDSSGKLVNVLGENPPVAGNTLVLNIDKDLQNLLYEKLSQAPGTSRGAAVALNPKTGQVLALVSSPGFDNNLFAAGISTVDYQKLLNDKNQPLFNRAISGTYPPGSTSKVMTATAGLQEKIITPETVIVDNGAITVPNQFGGPSYQFRGWKPGGLGPMTVTSAIAMSSDIFFYEVAGGSPNGNFQGLGPETLAQYYRKFGLGKPLGIDIQGEKSGLVPDPDWKEKYFNNDPLQGKWYLGDTYHIGIGQGDLLVTPLQVAEWTAVIANNGVGMRPQIAQKAVDYRGDVVWQNKPEVIIKDVASLENIKTVQAGMRQTVLAGTARALQALPITSAGKTGTSQFDGSNPERTHAWFTCYAPYEDPQIVITILVEAGGEGNAVAEPVAEQALLWWAKNRLNK